MFTDKRRGSLIVDAAMCLPIFIIAFGVLLMLIVQAGTEDAIMRGLVRGANSCSKAMVLAQAAADVQGGAADDEPPSANSGAAAPSADELLSANSGAAALSADKSPSANSGAAAPSADELLSANSGAAAPSADEPPSAKSGVAAPSADEPPSANSSAAAPAAADASDSSSAGSYAVAAAAFYASWSCPCQEHAQPDTQCPGARETFDKGLPMLTTGNRTTLSRGNITIDNIVHVNVSSKLSIPIPKAFVDTVRTEKKLAFRPFVGESENNRVFDNTSVYVFPKRGERYHVRSCYILKEGSVQQLLTKALRSRYSSCSTCHSDLLPNGAPVFLFSSASTMYHRKACPSITKSYVCMTKSDAKAAGYTPCQICGGGE